MVMTFIRAERKYFYSINIKSQINLLTFCVVNLQEIIDKNSEKLEITRL